MIEHLATGGSGSSLPAAIAVISGGIVGVLIRILIQSALGEKSSRRSLWGVELAGAGVLGGVIAVPILISLNAATWVTSCFGPAMTTYAAACAAFAYIARRAEVGNPVRAAFLHFAAASLSTIVGFFVVFSIIRTIPGH